MTTLASPPVFVIGHPRSGTSWLTDLLGEHPRLASARETHLFNLYLEPLLERRDLWLDDWIDQPALNSLLADLVSGIFQSLLDRKGKFRVVEKTPTHRNWVRQIHALFPGARFVHAIRDGRDVARSMFERHRIKKDHWIPRTMTGCAHRWQNAVEGVERAKGELGRELFIDVYYEHLAADPVSQVDRILRFIDEAVPRTTIEAMIARHPPDTRRVENWRHTLSTRQQAAFLDVAGQLLSRLGYSER